MKSFADLFSALDANTRIDVKTAALAAYFRRAPTDDRLSTIALLSGRRPKRTITAGRLGEWAAEVAGLPDWLFAESHTLVGDLAETIALVLPAPKQLSNHSLTYWISYIKTLSLHDEDTRKDGILAAWESLGQTERLLFTKLLTGSFRVGVSTKLVMHALAQATGQNEAVLTHKLKGNWTPDTANWAQLIEADNLQADLSRPYPFCLASSLESVDDLGELTDWSAERKWDGIRCQFILRGDEHYIWSRGGDLMTDRFPELAVLRDFLPDGTVIDGEVLPYAENHPLPFSTLHKRIGRKTFPKSLLSTAPVILMAYDLLEIDGKDIRSEPFMMRRNRLTQLLNVAANLPIKVSGILPFDSWESLAAERVKSRELGAEGLMLKKLHSPYLGGRNKGNWWKWKTDPLTIDAVMIYAQAGPGGRATLFTDYTFAVWNGPDLVPITKAHSGLTDDELRKITAWVRNNTRQKFGPVRVVPPEHVFEIGFEGIQESSRHKSGVVLRFPRILRWRHDKPAAEANTIDDLKAMLARYGSPAASPGQ